MEFSNQNYEYLRNANIWLDVIDLVSFSGYQNR